ncbi:hypothetical protein diail_5581 [Diaporthe ilicicola]|nr:hypothetical protein diail_5581 [Diaporthe ilicicola]
MEHLLLPSGLRTAGVLATVAVVLVGYKLLVILYNTSPLHPLSQIPGPKLAAASYLPEFYYDVICGGGYTAKIREMHEKYDEIYAVGGRKRDKTMHQINAAPVGTKTGFGTVDHDLHRSRRAPLAKFFSRTATVNLEGEIAAQAQRLCDKIMAQRGNSTPFDMTIAYSNLSTDIVSGYCFGESFNLLDQPGWSPNFREPNLATLKYWFILRFFPVLRNLLDLGVWFIDYLPDDMALFIRTIQIDIPKMVMRTVDKLNSGIVYKRPILVAALLDSNMSEEDKSPERMCLSVLTYHVLTNSAIFETLTQELKEAIPDSQHLPHWATLEKLPCLSGVIHEGLRLSYGTSGRTARVATEEDLVYRGEWRGNPIRYMIPRGYPVGMSAFISHHDEKLFPDSHKFQPERWLDAQRRKELDRGFLAFSKGSRACLGMK